MPGVGRQTILALLPASGANRKAAEIKARTIELDMTSGNYKPEQQQQIFVTKLFDRFLAYKQRQVTDRTFTKYIGLQKHVSVFFGNKTIVSVTETVSENFRSWLLVDRRLSPITVRERIVMMNACWEWEAAALLWKHCSPECDRSR